MSSNTYNVTTSNLNSTSFWSSISEGTDGHTLDFSALPANYSVLFDVDHGSLIITDGTSSITVTDSTYPGVGGTPIGGGTLLSSFNVFVGGSGASLINATVSDDTVTTTGGDGTSINPVKSGSTGLGSNTSLSVTNSTDTTIYLVRIEADGSQTHHATIDQGAMFNGTVPTDDNFIITNEDFLFIELIEGAPNQTVDIGAGGTNDTIVSGTGDDTIRGLFGDDSISSGGGADSVHGGTGNDTIDAGSGADTVIGGRNDDSILGGAGNDTLDGGFDDDTVKGGAGNDAISGDNSSTSTTYYITDTGDLFSYDTSTGASTHQASTGFMFGTLPLPPTGRSTVSRSMPQMTRLNPLIRKRVQQPLRRICRTQRPLTHH